MPAQESEALDDTLTILEEVCADTALTTTDITFLNYESFPQARALSVEAACSAEFLECGLLPKLVILKIPTNFSFLDSLR